MDRWRCNHNNPLNTSLSNECSIMESRAKDNILYGLIYGGVASFRFTRFSHSDMSAGTCWQWTSIKLGSSALRGGQLVVRPRWNQNEEEVAAWLEASEVEDIKLNEPERPWLRSRHSCLHEKKREQRELAEVTSKRSRAADRESVKESSRNGWQRSKLHRSEIQYVYQLHRRYETLLVVGLQKWAVETHQKHFQSAWPQG